MLSSHRQFLRRVDLLDICNPNKGHKGDPLSLFMFSDSMEVREGGREIQRERRRRGKGWMGE